MARPPRLRESPSQTAGPYVHIGLMPNLSGIAGVYGTDPGAVMVDETTMGERIAIVGHVFDGAGEPLLDAVIEIWQADAEGHYASCNAQGGGADDIFTGWGRQATDMQTGVYRFDTIKPGRVPGPDGRLQAPHISLWIVARGINLGLNTRLYFADEPEANAEDPVLADLAGPERAATLLAQPQGSGVYRFDIHLQGERETVFFDV